MSKLSGTVNWLVMVWGLNLIDWVVFVWESGRQGSWLIVYMDICVTGVNYSWKKKEKVVEDNQRG